jgi:hypothetical protein
VLVGHSDELNLLDVWKAQGRLPSYLGQNRVLMYIAGGHVDWDYAEFASKLGDAEAMIYVRTHQASSAMRDKASGISHFRVIEMNGDQIDWVAPARSRAERVADSLATGSLAVFCDTPNDGTEPTVAATVRSGLPRAYDDGRVWLWVAKRDALPPEVVGAELVHAFDEGAFWLCECAVRLPQMASVRVTASSEALPARPAIEVRLDGPDELVFEEHRTPDGLRYFASRQTLVLELENVCQESALLWPVASLLGREVPFEREVREKLPLLLPAGQTLHLRLNLTVGEMWPGRHELHVHFRDDPLGVLHSFPVQVGVK